MKTNLRERVTRYRCFIRPKVHFAPEFSLSMHTVHVTNISLLSECIIQISLTINSHILFEFYCLPDSAKTHWPSWTEVTLLPTETPCWTQKWTLHKLYDLIFSFFLIHIFTASLAPRDNDLALCAEKTIQQ